PGLPNFWKFSKPISSGAFQNVFYVVIASARQTVCKNCGKSLLLRPSGAAYMQLLKSPGVQAAPLGRRLLQYKVINRMPRWGISVIALYCFPISDKMKCT
ncbi:MAG: hypothetical protein AAGJ82_15110, partial [Bacteroidota bacterium]